MGRTKALEVPFDYDWRPKPGDFVWVPAIAGKLSWKVSWGTVEMVNLPYVVVCVRDSQQEWRKAWTIDELRPLTGWRLFTAMVKNTVDGWY